MDLEPFGEAGRERAAVLEFARRNALPDGGRNLHDLRVLALMAMDGREVRELHPGGLALEVMAGVLDQCIETIGDLGIGRMQEGIEVEGELSVVVGYYG